MAVAKENPIKIPATIAKCADLLYLTQQARYKVNKQAAKLKELETALEEHIINNLPKDSTGVAGRTAQVRVESDPVQTVDVENEGWEKLWAWVKKQRGTDGFAILNRAINRKAIGELQEAGKEVPGLKTFNQKWVSCTKLKARG